MDLSERPLHSIECPSHRKRPRGQAPIGENGLRKRWDAAEGGWVEGVAPEEDLSLGAAAVVGLVAPAGVLIEVRAPRHVEELGHRRIGRPRRVRAQQPVHSEL